MKLLRKTKEKIIETNRSIPRYFFSLFKKEKRINAEGSAFLLKRTHKEIDKNKVYDYYRSERREILVMARSLNDKQVFSR